MKAPAESLRHWLPGPGLALAGVIAVRWLAPALGGRAQAIVIVIGYLLVPFGLAWFAARLGRRAADRAALAAERRD